MLKGASYKLEGEVFINFLLVGLSLGNLEDKPASFLILFIFPFWLDSLPEKLNRVDFLQRALNLVSK